MAEAGESVELDGETRGFGNERSNENEGTQPETVPNAEEENKDEDPREILDTDASDNDSDINPGSKRKRHQGGDQPNKKPVGILAPPPEIRDGITCVQTRKGNWIPKAEATMSKKTGWWVSKATSEARRNAGAAGGVASGRARREGTGLGTGENQPQTETEPNANKKRSKKKGTPLFGTTTNQPSTLAGLKKAPAVKEHLGTKKTVEIVQDLVPEGTIFLDPTGTVLETELKVIMKPKVYIELDLEHMNKLRQEKGVEVMNQIRQDESAKMRAELRANLEMSERNKIRNELATTFNKKFDIAKEKYESKRNTELQAKEDALNKTYEEKTRDLEARYQQQCEENTKSTQAALDRMTEQFKSMMSFGFLPPQPQKPAVPLVQQAVSPPLPATTTPAQLQPETASEANPTVSSSGQVKPNPQASQTEASQPKPKSLPPATRPKSPDSQTNQIDDKDVNSALDETTI